MNELRKYLDRITGSTRMSYHVHSVILSKEDSIMKHGRKILQIIAVLTFFLSGGVARAMTLDEAFEKLATHRFGRDDEALNFLREAAVTSHSDPAVRKKLNDRLTRILDSDAAYDARQFACRQLALTATEEQIPVLARKLGDEKMTHMALYVLTHIDSPEVDKALLLALETATGNARLGIVNMLGNRRSADAVKPLGELMISGDEKTSIAAIRALGRIGTDAAYSQFVLYDVADDPPGKLSHAMKMAFTHANLDFADRFLANGRTGQAERLYQSAFGEHNPAHIRAAGLKGLVATMGEYVEPYVAQALKDDDQQLYRMAAVMVATVRKRTTAEKIAAEFPELQPHVQVLLINALATRRDGAGVAIVESACESSDALVRQTALGALGKIGHASCVPLLIEHAASGAERDIALSSLTNLVGENVNAALIRKLREGNSAEKVAICRALLGRNATESAPDLVEAARAADSSVRAEALKALHSLAGPRQMPALVDLIFAIEPTEVDQVGKALTALARRHSMTLECTQTILFKQDRAANTDQQVALLQTLGSLGHELALPKLREALRDEDGQIRYAAIKALSAWPDAAPADDLLEVAKSASSQTHRVLALRGFIDLIDAAELPADRKLAHYQQAMRLADQASPERSRGDAERKKVLSVLAGLDTLEAFRMAVSYLDEPPLKNEAALAACRIAQRIYATKGSQIKDDLERIASADVAEATRQQAREILQNINKLELRIEN